MTCSLVAQSSGLLLIAIIAIVAAVRAVAVKAFEMIFYWAQQYEAYEVEEILTVGWMWLPRKP
jgi:hypothetical protein